jgi:hypothetical protein
MVNEECELKWESGSMASSVVLRGGGWRQSKHECPVKIIRKTKSNEILSGDDD